MCDPGVSDEGMVAGTVVAGMVDGVSYLTYGAAIAGGHHEHFDGNGYPNQLKGTDIPVAARIVAEKRYVAKAVLGSLARRVTTPIACFVIFNVTLAGWHLPPVYNSALAFHWVHIIQHLMFKALFELSRDRSEFISAAREVQAARSADVFVQVGFELFVERAVLLAHGEWLDLDDLSLPSLFTLGNMFCGYACIVYAMRGEFQTAAPFIGFAMVLDMLDRQSTAPVALHDIAAAPVDEFQHAEHGEAEAETVAPRGVHALRRDDAVVSAKNHAGRSARALSSLRRQGPQADRA